MYVYSDLLCSHVHVNYVLFLQAVEQQYGDAQPAISEAMRQAGMFAAQASGDSGTSIYIHDAVKALQQCS